MVKSQSIEGEESESIRGNEREVYDENANGQLRLRHEMKQKQQNEQNFGKEPAWSQF